MLGNRFFTAKLMASLALFGILCAVSRKLGEDVNPEYWRCRVRHDHFVGKRLWIPAEPVLRPDADGFFIEQEDSLIRVHYRGPETFREGDRVGLVAEYRTDSSLDGLHVKRRRFSSDMRWWMILLSVPPVLWALLYFRRAFLLRWDRMVLHPTALAKKKEAGRG